MNSTSTTQERRVHRGKKREKKRFLAVDVNRAHFGPISVKAVYDVFSQKFNIEPKDMQGYSFSDCVNALRKLEEDES